MRKHYKKKRHSCPLCKPYKMQGENRWSPKEQAALKEFEKLVRRTIRVSRPILRGLE